MVWLLFGEKQRHMWIKRDLVFPFPVWSAGQARKETAPTVIRPETLDYPLNS
jgi:hypothetical protein